MSALILKDLYIMKKYCRSVLLMVVIFWGASIFADSGNLFWTFFPVIVGSVTPATLLSYDEKFRWNQYCDTMPISRAAVVAEKYVLTAADGAAAHSGFCRRAADGIRQDGRSAGRSRPNCGADLHRRSAAAVRHAARSV